MVYLNICFVQQIYKNLRFIEKSLAINLANRLLILYEVRYKLIFHKKDFKLN